MSLNCNPPTTCTDGCYDILDSKCVVFKQPTLVCTNIEQNDTVEEAIIKLDTAICDIANGGDDKYVRITTNDTTSGYLSTKLVAGDNITFTTLNPGLNEQIRVSLTPTALVQTNLVVTSSDNSLAIVQSGTADHTLDLSMNISATSNNIINVVGDGLVALETAFVPNNGLGILATPGGTNGHSPVYDIKIDPTSSTALTVSPGGLKLTLPAVYVPDYKVKVDVADTPDYLESQIVAGTDPLGIVSISISKVNGQLVITPTIDKSVLCAVVVQECNCSQPNGGEAN